MSTIAGRRILYLVNDDRFFWSHRLPLAQAARDAGAEVAVAAPAGAHRARIEAAGFAFHPVPLQKVSIHPVRELRAAGHIARLYRELRPHLVHHVTLKPIVYGGRAARRLGIPAVHAVTGLGYVYTGEDAKRRLLRRVAEAGYRYALGHPRSRTVFQNPDDLALFVEKGLVRRERAEVIPGSGVDPERFRPAPEPPQPPITVLLAARMLWDKGVGDLVEAARLLRAREVPIRVVLAGNPDPLNPSAIPPAQLEAWQREGLAEWLGHQADMAGLLQACHVFCLPSRYREGIPLALLEAAACGRPIVTADAPGCREVVQHQDNGLLMPPGDPAALAGALERLAADAALRQTMGRRGRERVLARFTAAHVAEQTLRLYEGLLEGGEGLRQ